MVVSQKGPQCIPKGFQGSYILQKEVKMSKKMNLTFLHQMEMDRKRMQKIIAGAEPASCSANCICGELDGWTSGYVSGSKPDVSSW